MRRILVPDLFFFIFFSGSLGLDIEALCPFCYMEGGGCGIRGGKAEADTVGIGSVVVVCC